MSEPATALPVEAGKVTCPACGSVHSADGGTLLERSARLRDLEDAKPKLEKMRKIADRLEKQLQDAKRKPRAAAPAPAPAPGPAAAPEPAPKPAAKEEKKKHGKYL